MDRWHQISNNIHHYNQTDKLERSLKISNRVSHMTILRNVICALKSFSFYKARCHCDATEIVRFAPRKDTPMVTIKAMGKDMIVGYW